MKHPAVLGGGATSAQEAGTTSRICGCEINFTRPMYGTAPSRLSCRAMYGTAPSRVCLVVHTRGQAKLVLSRYRTHARGSVVNIHTTHTQSEFSSQARRRAHFLEGCACGHVRSRVLVCPRRRGRLTPAGGAGSQWHPASRRPHTLVGVWLVHIRAMADAPCAGARWRGATCSVVGPASGSAAIGQVRHVRRPPCKARGDAPSFSRLISRRLLKILAR